MSPPELSRPSDDVDSTFAATTPDDTPRLMEALRQAGIYFDVSVNSHKEDPSSQDYDWFFFRKEDDQDMIGSIIRKTFPKNEQ